MDNKKCVEIYWDDLTESKKQEIFEMLGDNGNYGAFPIAAVYAYEEDETEEEAMGLTLG